jgi:hypothetical protein
MELNAVEICRISEKPAASIFAEKRQPLWKNGEFLRTYLYMLIILIDFIGVFNSMWIFRNISLPNLKIGLPSLINIAFLWLAKVIRGNIISKSKKVKCTLVQAPRLCTGRTAHRGSRGIALLFHDHGTRSGWGASVMPRPLFTPGKDPVPIVQEAGWAPGPNWTGAENLAPTGIRCPDRPARSQSLYRLRYPARNLISAIDKITENYLNKDRSLWLRI